jgi:hypothetical protein
MQLTQKTLNDNKQVISIRKITMDSLAPIIKKYVFHNSEWRKIYNTLFNKRVT